MGPLPKRYHRQDRTSRRPARPVLLMPLCMLLLAPLLSVSGSAVTSWSFEKTERLQSQLQSILQERHQDQTLLTSPLPSPPSAEADDSFHASRLPLVARPRPGSPKTKLRLLQHTLDNIEHRLRRSKTMKLGMIPFVPEVFSVHSNRKHAASPVGDPSASQQHLPPGANPRLLRALVGDVSRPVPAPHDFEVEKVQADRATQGFDGTTTLVPPRSAKLAATERVTALKEAAAVRKKTAGSRSDTKDPVYETISAPDAPVMAAEAADLINGDIEDSVYRRLKANGRNNAESPKQPSSMLHSQPTGALSILRQIPARLSLLHSQTLNTLSMVQQAWMSHVDKMTTKLDALTTGTSGSTLIAGVPIEYVVLGAIAALVGLVAFGLLGFHLYKNWGTKGSKVDLSHHPIYQQDRAAAPQPGMGRPGFHQPYGHRPASRMGHHYEPPWPAAPVETHVGGRLPSRPIQSQQGGIARPDPIYFPHAQGTHRTVAKPDPVYTDAVHGRPPPTLDANMMRNPSLYGRASLTSQRNSLERMAAKQTAPEPINALGFNSMPDATRSRLTYERKAAEQTRADLFDAHKLPHGQRTYQPGNIPGAQGSQVVGRRVHTYSPPWTHDVVDPQNPASIQPQRRPVSMHTYSPPAYTPPANQPRYLLPSLSNAAAVLRDGKGGDHDHGDPSHNPRNTSPTRHYTAPASQQERRSRNNILPEKFRAVPYESWRKTHAPEAARREHFDSKQAELAPRLSLSRLGKHVANQLASIGQGHGVAGQHHGPIGHQPSASIADQPERGPRSHEPTPLPPPDSLKNVLAAPASSDEGPATAGRLPSSMARTHPLIVDAASNSHSKVSTPVDGRESFDSVRYVRGEYPPHVRHVDDVSRPTSAKALASAQMPQNPSYGQPAVSTQDAVKGTAPNDKVDATQTGAKDMEILYALYPECNRSLREILAALTREDHGLTNADLAVVYTRPGSARQALSQKIRSLPRRFHQLEGSQQEVVVQAYADAIAERNERRTPRGHDDDWLAELSQAYEEAKLHREQAGYKLPTPKYRSVDTSLGKPDKRNGRKGADSAGSDIAPIVDALHRAHTSINDGAVHYNASGDGKIIREPPPVMSTRRYNQIPQAELDNIERLNKIPCEPAIYQPKIKADLRKVASAKAVHEAELQKWR